MNNKKEAAEHATIVDLIRNDLGMIANQISVSRYRYIDRLATNKRTNIADEFGDLQDNSLLITEKKLVVCSSVYCPLDQ